jgi:hypothetical protein
MQADGLLAGRFHFLLHIDSTRRLRLNLNLLAETDRPLDDLPLLERRMRNHDGLIPASPTDLLPASAGISADGRWQKGPIRPHGLPILLNW